MQFAPLSTRGVVLRCDDGSVMPAVQVLSPEGKELLMLDAKRVGRFLACVQGCSVTALSLAETMVNGSPEQKALAMADAGGRA